MMTSAFFFWRNFVERKKVPVPGKNKPESKVLVFVTRKMIKEWCERQVPRKVLGDSHLKNLDNWLKKIGRYANIHL